MTVAKRVVRPGVACLVILVRLDFNLPTETVSERKKVNVLFNDALNTFYLRLYRKEIFYLTTHSTHFIYGYMVSDIW